MKKILIFCFLLNISFVFAQLTYVPDDNFEQVLIDRGWDDVLDDYVLTANISNRNNLDVGWYFISDLTGIEDFTALVYLDCSDNQLSNLDISQNTDLTKLYCSGNQLTNLDVSQNTALTILFCTNNQLTNLDVSQNTDLTIFICEQNQITQMDVSQNTDLIALFCARNLLSNLDVSQNTALEELSCFRNQLTNLDVSQNTTLEVLLCSINLLSNLDVSQNTALEELHCADNQLTNIDVSQNTTLARLDCADNQLTNLDVSQNTALTYFRCVSNQLANIDIRNGNNTNIQNIHFLTGDNSNLTCIFVDDAAWSAANWTLIDPNSTFVETQVECDTLSINELDVDENIKIFPNPANDLLNIQHSDKIEIDIIELYNYLGNVMIRTDKGLMNVSKMNTGIYMLRIITKDNEIISKRIIIKNE